MLAMGVREGRGRGLRMQTCARARVRAMLCVCVNRAVKGPLRVSPLLVVSAPQYRHDRVQLLPHVAVDRKPVRFLRERRGH